MAVDIDSYIARALERRQTLTAGDATEAYRLFNGTADGIDGLVIERFADVLIVQTHEGRLRPSLDRVRGAVDRLGEQLGTRAAYRKVFVSDRAKASAAVADMHVDPQPWIGDRVDPSRVIVEHGLRFIVRPYDGFSVGLFLEHRENRRRVRELADGRRVLNTFSYTCGFSVAAAAGGAASVSSVDLSRRYLEWGKENFAVNEIDSAGHWFFCSDIYDFYKRAQRQGRRYDLIVLDPPTFGRMRRPKRAFVLTEQLDALVAGAVDLLDPGGIVLLATNCRQLERDRMVDALRAAGGERGCAIMDAPGLPTDFAGDPDYSKTVIARFD